MATMDVFELEDQDEMIEVPVTENLQEHISSRIAAIYDAYSNVHSTKTLRSIDRYMREMKRVSQLKVPEPRLTVDNTFYVTGKGRVRRWICKLCGEDNGRPVTIKYTRKEAMFHLRGYHLFDFLKCSTCPFRTNRDEKLKEHLRLGHIEVQPDQLVLYCSGEKLLLLQSKHPIMLDVVDSYRHLVTFYWTDLPENIAVTSLSQCVAMSLGFTRYMDLLAYLGHMIKLLDLYIKDKRYVLYKSVIRAATSHKLRIVPGGPQSNCVV